MKFLKNILLYALASAICAGCATTSVNTEFALDIKAEGKKPAASITAENYGYYLFGYVPLFAGDPDSQNDVSMSFFEDTVTIENNLAMITREKEKVGADSLTNLRNHTFWTGSFSLWIVWRQVLKSNALALKEDCPQTQQTAL